MFLVKYLSLLFIFLCVICKFKARGFLFGQIQWHVNLCNFGN